MSQGSLETGKCPKSAKDDYPHHWECIQTDGHIGCNCNNDSEKRCRSFECTLEDGTNRYPDGSIGARSHLKKGGIAVRSHNIATGKTKLYF